MTNLVLYRRSGRSRARGRARRAPHAHRQRPRRAARRDAAGDAVRPSSLRHADHRLEPRDRRTVARRRARLLHALLHAGKRHSDRRGRCRRRGRGGARGADTYGKIPARAQAPSRAPSARAAAARRIGWSRSRTKKSNSLRTSGFSSCPPTPRPRRARPRRSRRSRAYAWRRPRQRALRNAGRRGEAGGLRRRLLHGIRARRHALYIYRDAGGRRGAQGSRHRARPRAGEVHRDEHKRGRFAARQDAA